METTTGVWGWRRAGGASTKTIRRKIRKQNFKIDFETKMVSMQSSSRK